MKKPILAVGCILLSLLFQTCRDDESVNMSRVQFTFSASALEEAGGRILSDLPEGSVLFVSITKSNGDVVHTLKELSLVKFGDEFVSSPLPLTHGHYKITEFLVANANHEVLYATPQEGSPLASLVEHPLPIAFDVVGNEITDLGVEVISTTAHQPDEFGYVSFSIDVVPTEAFQLSVFIPGENGMEFTTAQAYILHEGDTIYEEYLSSGTHGILLDENPDDSITLVLIEPSYKKYSRTFTVNALQEELLGDPLSVCLLPALTFTAIPYLTPSGDYAFEFYPSGDSQAPGMLSIDWGDGSSSNLNIHNYSFNSHHYATDGPYFISVSGGLDAIEALYIYYTHVTDVSVRQLSKLQDLSIGGGTTPASIDLSHNPELASINFAMGTFTSIDISNNPLLSFVGLEFNTGISADEINALVDNLYQHATENNITGGYLGIGADWDLSLIGPPSEASLEKIRTLRSEYGWITYPSEF